MRAFVVLLLSVLFVTPVFASDDAQIENLRAEALKGDYQAQRNLAYLLKDTNRFEGCIWRAIIVLSGYSEVGLGDVGNLQVECSKKMSSENFNHILELAEEFSQKIYSGVPAGTPGLGASIYVKYPPKEDSEENTLFKLEQEAFTGAVAAQRKLAEFLEKAAAVKGIPLRNNLMEDAYAWRKVVVAGSLGSVSVEDKLAYERLHQTLSHEQRIIADSRANRIYQEIMKIKRSNGSK